MNFTKNIKNDNFMTENYIIPLSDINVAPTVFTKKVLLSYPQ